MEAASQILHLVISHTVSSTNIKVDLTISTQEYAGLASLNAG